MLLYQGVAQFEAWTEQDAPVEVMRSALMEMIKG
jgi:shikimate 5-dehydrogenase